MKPKRAEQCIYGSQETCTRYSFIEPPEVHQPMLRDRLNPSDSTIALQSALAAGICLGLPTGLYFWVLILQRSAPSALLDGLFHFLQAYLVPPVILELLGALGWGLCLSKISGYRAWWWVSLAALAGVRLGHYALYHALLEQWVHDYVLSGLALHMQFGIILTMTVVAVTVSMGLFLGLVLMNWRAALALAGSTGLTAVIMALVTLIILDGLGIRVGSGNAAMPKATAAATMAAALAGGAVLGVMFRRYLRAGDSKHRTDIN